MGDDFLTWVARNATWGQTLKVMWWLTFNNKKSYALEGLYLEGYHFKYAYDRVQEIFKK